MFTRSPIFIRFQHYGRRVADRSWWLLMAPGLALMALALAILIWPELLAYLVAFGLLFVGLDPAPGRTPGPALPGGIPGTADRLL